MKHLSFIGVIFVLGMRLSFANDTSAPSVPSEIRFVPTKVPSKLNYTWSGWDDKMIFAEGKQVRKVMSDESHFTAYTGGSTVFKERPTPSSRCEVSRLVEKNGKLVEEAPETNYWFLEGGLSFVKSLPLPEEKGNKYVKFVYESKMVFHALFKSFGFRTTVPPTRSVDGWVEIKCFDSAFLGDLDSGIATFEKAFGNLIDKVEWHNRSSAQVDQSIKTFGGQSPVVRDKNPILPQNDLLKTMKANEI